MADWPELAGPADEVAVLLLGAELQHGGVAVRVTEVEAYAGSGDPASHAYRGRTRRNETMYAAAGHLYCYFTYGMHVCANVVTGPAGEASAVLLRAGEVVTGVDQARARRPGVAEVALARGPANLCRALGIGLDLDGAVLDDTRTAALALVPPQPRTDPAAVSRGPRVGVRQGWETPWRFWLTGDPTVSAYRRHPRADPGTPRN